MLPKIAQTCRDRPGLQGSDGWPDAELPHGETIPAASSRGGLFDQMPERCLEAGLESLEHAALDGTRIEANASKQKTRR